MIEQYYLIGDERSLLWALQFLPVLIISVLFALASTWLCKKVAIKFGIVDKPDNFVKTHKKPIAYLGGVGMFAGLAVGVLVGIYLIKDYPNFNKSLLWLIGIFVGAFIACFVGLIDDLFDITPKKKLLGQFVASLFLVFVGIKPSINSLTGPLGFTFNPIVEQFIAIPVVMIFVLGSTNSLNLLDGLDGLCAGVTAIITFAMLILAWHLSTFAFSHTGDPVRLILCFAMIGGTFGFLPFNKHPAKIFMGDAGSILLGFICATLMILFAESIPRWWMASVVIFGLPILDTATALARRLLNKRPLFLSDRGHIYDQMIDRGIPLKKTVFISYLLSAMYAIIGVGVAISPIRTRFAIFIYIFTFLISGLVIWKKGFLKMSGHRGAATKDPGENQTV